MNTPPESATVSMPSRAQISLAMRADARAMAIWKSSASLSVGAPADKLALDFHIAIARASAQVASEICAHKGIDTVALSGGVFMHRLLLQLLTRELKDAGLAVLVPHAVPVNDGCIAYGQAAVARARLAQVIPQ